MQDQLKEILQKMGKRLDLVTMGALIAILVVTGFMYVQESGFVIPEEAEPPVNQFQARIPAPRLGEADPVSSAAIERLEDRFINVQPSIEQDDEALRLIRTNMFDQKSVQEQGEARRELNRRFQQADALYRQNRTQDALRIVEEILQQDPNHPEARNLRDSIQQAENPATEAAPEG